MSAKLGVLDPDSQRVRAGTRNAATPERRRVPSAFRFADPLLREGPVPAGSAPVRR